MYQVLHPPNAMTDQVKASLSELLTRELLKNELANFTGTINVSVFITRANPQVSLVVLDRKLSCLSKFKIFNVL